MALRHQLRSGVGSPLPCGTRDPASLLPPGFCRLPRGGLEAWSRGPFVRQLRGTKCLKGADSLLDGGDGPCVGPRVAPGRGRWLSAGGRLCSANPQTSQALAKPGRLGGHGRTLLPGAAVGRLVDLGSTAGGIQLWRGPGRVALRPLCTPAGSGLQWHGAVVLTHDGAKQTPDAVGNPDPRVFGCGVGAVVHPSLPPEQRVGHCGAETRPVPGVTPGRECSSQS